MNEGLIPRRYAKALLAFASDKGEDARIYSLMRELARSFEGRPALQEAVANPFVSDADKAALINIASGLIAPASDPVMTDFLRLLAERRRIDLIRPIALAYIDLYRRKNNIYSVKVTSAAPLEAEALEKIKDNVARHLGQDAKIEFNDAVDPSLIGGFTITVGNEKLDASIANDLKQLRQRLLSHS